MKPPFSYHSTQTTIKKPFPYDHQNPSSSPSSSSRHHHDQEEPPCFLHFPSPFLDGQDTPLSQAIPHPSPAVEDTADDGARLKKGGSSTAVKRKLGATPRRRTGKKDRHSKISTAKGVRDRRMRLSIQIARKFFDLQDMLGFDKASKTIEWLFSKSKNAIMELMSSKNNNAPSSSGDDEHEVGSIIEENSNSNNDVTNEKKMMMMTKGLENNSSHNNNLYETNPSSLDQLGSSSNSPFLEESTCHQDINNHNPQLGFESQFPNSVEVMEKYLGGTSFGASMLDYHHHDNGDQSFMGFLGNWELSNPNIDGFAPFSGINNPSTLYYGASSFQLQPLDQDKQFPYNHNI